MNAEKREQIKEIKSALVQNYIEAKQGSYETKTLAERVDFVSKTMQLSKEYCCLLWDIDPNTISLGFDFSSRNNRIFNEKTQQYDQNQITYSFLGCFMHRPETVYKVCFHELRHTYQREHPFSPESKSYYKNIPTDSKVFNTAWQGSPNEFGADRFGFKETLGILKQALNQNSQAVHPCDVNEISILAKNNLLAHLGSTPFAGILGAFYNAKSNFARFTNSSHQTSVTTKENSFLTIEQMQNLALSNPDFFNRSLPVLLNKEDISNYPNEVKEIEDYMHLVDYSDVRDSNPNLTTATEENTEDPNISSEEDTTSAQISDLTTEQNAATDNQVCVSLNTASSSPQTEVLTQQNTEIIAVTEISSAPVADACMTE